MKTKLISGLSMDPKEIERKSLDNQEFLKLRSATEKISAELLKRVKRHLNILRPLFVPRKLLGTYVRSGTMEEVPGSDKAFAELQERFASVAQKPFGLPSKLKTPLAPIPNQLEAAPFQYSLHSEGSPDKAITITTSAKWLISFHSDCSLGRLKAMLAGEEPKQPEDMKQAVIHHLLPVIFLHRFNDVAGLLEDLRYVVRTEEIAELGGLPVVTLEAPLKTFLPPDDFIQQITQLSGIPAFQEIIDLEAINSLTDPLKESIKALV
jgi:hypothetical protein